MCAVPRPVPPSKPRSTMTERGGAEAALSQVWARVVVPAEVVSMAETWAEAPVPVPAWRRLSRAP